MEAVLTDWRSAPVSERLRAMLGFVEKLTLRPESVTGADVAPLRAAGLSDRAMEEAIHVCAQFSMYTRLADAFGFRIPGRYGFERSAAMLLRFGYD